MLSEEKFLERLNSLFDSDPRTDTAIADALGVSKQTVSYWRQGVRSPKKTMIVKIAELYNVSPVWLFGWGDDMDRRPVSDADRLEALHQNPRLGLLFDRQRNMSPEDVEFMLQMADRILKERDHD